MDRIDHHQLLRGLAAARVAVGSSLLVAPGIAGRVWFGDEARRPVAKVAARAIGIRDLALGAGALHALDTGASPKPWAFLGAAADAVDGFATLLAFRHLPKTRLLLVLGVAGSSALAHLSVSDNLD